MEDIDSSPIASDSPHQLKRHAPEEDAPGQKPLNLKGNQFVMPTPPDTEESSNASPHASTAQQRPASPALSISTLSSVDLSLNGAPNPTTPAGTASGSKPPPAKRRKLTPSENLEKQREKEVKEKERAEKKARKKEEQRVRDDEKRVRDEEKRRKAEEKEAKKREKELEEQRKEEAKMKKERSQMRLGAFFGAKPATLAKSPASGTPTIPDTSRCKSLSLEPYDATAGQRRRSQSPAKGPQPEVQAEHKPVTPAKPSISDYRKYFLPYELPNHTTLAQTYRIPNPDDLAYWQGAFDEEIKDPSFQEKIDLGLLELTAEVDHMFRADSSSRRGLPQPSLRALIEEIQGTSSRTIDLTDETPVSSQPAIQRLQNVTRRHIHFYEDVRPAYFGTSTQIRSPRAARKIMLNPFSKARTDTNYDYDSEAEWEEPEEGEELLGDEEDEADSVGDPDDLDGFLDDEDDALKNRRKMITGDLQPTSTGLCWEDEKNCVVQSIEGEEFLGTPKEIKGMAIGFLLPNFKGRTIDPFSTSYWVNDMAPPGLPISDVPSAVSRPPLQERHSNVSLSQSLKGAAEGEKGPITAIATQITQQEGNRSTQGAKRGPRGQSKTLSKEDLDEFKEAIVGSNLKKLELQKALKARFPKMTNETIKETLSTQFALLGAGKEKKWAFVTTS
ncbi:hypothetical protein EJ03DRAFT_88085 [Teratosphaeria nubilosa]|uniref:Chromatin assembly factor 1 subunit A n=1 Tax=Teratosphaeria nubilosa TaxID=161662 RepID=A0A6G1LA88_9PEZI|nr:hypothetical protein EJ03DRAFT_88085 [Teratosphaeria nubilosa]